MDSEYNFYLQKVGQGQEVQFLPSKGRSGTESTIFTFKAYVKDREYNFYLQKVSQGQENNFTVKR